MDAAKNPDGEGNNKSMNWIMKNRREILTGFMLFILLLFTILFFARYLGFEYSSQDVPIAMIAFPGPNPGEVIGVENDEPDENVEDVWGALHEEVEEPNLPPEECERP